MKEVRWRMRSRDEVEARLEGWRERLRRGADATADAAALVELLQAAHACGELEWVLAGAEAAPGEREAAATVLCPSCGGAVLPGQRFCTACGAALSDVCPGCGAGVLPGQRFCTGCGRQLD
jgi:predicted nucleic acid-binding Zn ribbon protein